MSAYSDAVLADAPAGYWRLDEPAGPAASSGTVPLALTATGGPTFGATSGPGLGTAVLFDGVDDHLRHATAADANGLRRASAAPSYSLEAWVMPTNVTGTAGIYVHRLAANTTQAALFLGAGGQVLVDLGNGTAGSGRWATAYSVPAGQWTHLVPTYDSATTTWRLYANGVLVDTLVRAAPATVATSGFVSIGSATTNGTAAAFFPGRVDDVAVYPGTVLSPERVAAHYATGTAAAGAPSTTGAVPVTVTPSATASPAASGAMPATASPSATAAPMVTGALAVNASPTVTARPLLTAALPATALPSAEAVPAAAGALPVVVELTAAAAPLVPSPLPVQVQPTALGRAAVTGSIPISATPTATAEPAGPATPARDITVTATLTARRRTALLERPRARTAILGQPRWAATLEEPS